MMCGMKGACSKRMAHICKDMEAYTRSITGDPLEPKIKASMLKALQTGKYDAVFSDRYGARRDHD